MYKRQEFRAESRREVVVVICESAGAEKSGQGKYEKKIKMSKYKKQEMKL